MRVEGEPIPLTLYKVTGTTAYAGHQPGEEFEADLTPEQERRAKERGSIRVIKRENSKGGKDG